jgi:galactose mutarotase-like enzyme
MESTSDHVSATLTTEDLDRYWLSKTRVQVEATLRAEFVELKATAINAGRELLPMGIGWHPYFALPSKQRAQARLHLPAKKRARVNNYDDVFPTGQVESVTGTPYDFTDPVGAALGSRHFDDSFVDLEKTAEGHTRLEILDPAARYGLRVTALSPEVKALQVYSPPNESFVAVEPQFNWPDPFSAVWPPGTDTGMVILAPGREVKWAVRCELLMT